MKNVQKQRFSISFGLNRTKTMKKHRNRTKLAKQGLATSYQVRIGAPDCSNSGELRGTPGNSGELRGTPGNSGELRGTRRAASKWGEENRWNRQSWEPLALNLPQISLEPRRLGQEKRPILMKNIPNVPKKMPVEGGEKKPEFLIVWELTRSPKNLLLDQKHVKPT